MASKKNPSIFSTLQKTTANASAVNGEFTHQIPLDALEDNPLNRFSMAEDEEFLSTMHSMEKDGLLEDIIVTPSDTEGRYRIISGHRRVHASRKLGRATVPCKIRHYDSKLSELRALMGANIHRRNISAFDMARQLETLRSTLAEEGGLPDNVKEQSELMASQVDLSRATVERYLDLLNLDETVTAWAENGQMTMTDARRICTCNPPWKSTLPGTTPRATCPRWCTAPSHGQRRPSSPLPRQSPPRAPTPCGRSTPSEDRSGAASPN